MSVNALVKGAHGEGTTDRHRVIKRFECSGAQRSLFLPMHAVVLLLPEV